MAEYSRKEKYAQLRNQLQHDTLTDDSLNTPELSRFSKRLNQIDSNNFEAPGEVQSSREAVHAKAETPVEEIQSRIRAEAEKKPVFDISAYAGNENDTSLVDNDFLRDYIREVKEYNIEQGNAVSQNTSLNILNQINEISQPEEKRQPEPQKRPYRKEKPKAQRNDTADIPFMSPFRSASDDENTEKISVDEETDELNDLSEPTEVRTKEDIMAEVQSLVNGRQTPRKPKATQQDLYSEIEDDRTTRQRLLNETTQMRAQLDGYEDNLSEVNDKMRYTNKILNMVLAVLIVALGVMLFILIYWVILSRGA